MIVEVSKYVLIFFRILAMLWLLPIFSMRSVSVMFKVSFSLAISFLIVEVVSYPVDFAGNGYALLLAVVTEILIGLAISFAMRLLFAVIQATGEIIGFQTGFAFARVIDPVSSGQTSVLEQFLYMLVSGL